MADVSATPQSSTLGAIARYLRAARNVGNVVPLPQTFFGGGLGNFLLQHSPEEVENWSYGNSPVEMPEMSNIPQWKSPERMMGALDAIGALPVLKAPFRGAEALASAVPRAARDFALSNVPAHVIKPSGGNWLNGSVEQMLSGLKTPVPANPIDSAAALAAESFKPKAAVDNWIDKQLTRYVKNDMGTMDDPIRALAEIAAPPAFHIEQIKGKGNAKPKDTYIPYVQDFVKTQGPWSDFQDDFHHTDLFDPQALELQDHLTPEGLGAHKQLFGDANYFNGDELNTVLSKLGLADSQDVASHRDIADRLNDYGAALSPDNFAKGGSVHADYNQAVVAAHAAELNKLWDAAVL